MRSALLFTLMAVGLCGCPTEAPRPPIAAFTGSPVGGVLPLTVQFTDLSQAGTTPITQRFWNFGDAETGTGAAPIHTYTRVGKYSVTLRVVSASGEDVASKEKFVEVLKPEVGPQAHFSVDQQSGPAPLTVNFTDESVPGDRPVTTWRWDFGDGQRSTQQDPSHTYTAEGVYTVSLTVSNSVGADSITEAGLVTVF